MTYEEPNNRAADSCRCFLETIEILHELHTWANTEDDASTLSLVARRELLDRGWAEDQDREAIAESISREIDEDPLSIQWRSGWETVGAELEPAEFEVLLSTGGPATRIVGDLDPTFLMPCRPRLQHQDWFKPWTEYLDATSAQSEALEWYCGMFYFGE